MRPAVISETIQEFDGVRYYLCGQYFQRNGVRLHLAVWRKHRGPIPDGHHVHHRDEDRSHNWIDNLECITRAEHLGDRHGEASAERARPHLPKARRAAAKWHGSAKGRKWHSEHFEQHIRPVMDKRVPATCQECGAQYEASAAKLKQAKFCHQNCRARALRRRRKAERSG